MKFDTNRERGNAGLAMAIAYYGANGFTVSLPLNDTQDYDLIVDDGTDIFRVQAKFSSVRVPSGKFQFSLRSVGGQSGEVYKTVVHTKADILFATTADMQSYQIPIGYLDQEDTINLGGNDDEYAEFKVQI